MNTLQRNKRKLYLCKRDNTVDFEKYLEPQEIWYNYREVSNESVILATGNISTSYLIVKDVNSRIDVFDVGDRIYLQEPENFNITASDANYYVASKTIGLDFGEVILEAMVGKDGRNRY